ncbi:ADP-ribose pyrophosphatase protein [Salinisphaera shabanensis E1L3A]|jgi:ADP-ribose pyrophosphatase YjhB (NUDIX family)|uniref:ADP-ribose pyrophosphatase protein n=1 Tax=Salinisphaera shabanensis E1L3A TaxID=1033802 RepID=U2EAP8_9GAMM|nr:ADP-ribose pyrophosphatase protein [Salinisphaera shabanensis E1L3A]
MTYCPNCGAPTEFKIPAGDDRKRNICTATGEIFYDNPRNVVGCIVEHEDKILMCRRAIEPRLGFWTLPAGFLELGETIYQGAARETREEAQAEVRDAELFAMIDVTHIGQVHIFYRAKLAGSHYGAGQESQIALLQSEDEIEWSQLAFPTIHRALSHYFADRARGRFELHTDDLGADDWRQMNLDRVARTADEQS